MYFMPETLEELAAALKQKDEETWLCAGGTDLVIALREKDKFDFSLIDLTHLKKLREIEDLGGSLRVGAAVTMEDLEQSPLIMNWFPALSKSASMVGSTQIRNRATIGGNVANASQSSDLTPVIMAYGGTAVIMKADGSLRTLPVEELIIGLGKTVLEPGEAIVWFELEKRSGYSSFSKVGSRKAVTISKLNACICADLEGESLKEVCVYLGAVGEKGRKAPLIEEALEGQMLSSLPKEELREAVYCQIEDNIPDRSSKHYKKSAAYGLICDILEDFKGKAAEERRKGGHKA